MTGRKTIPMALALGIAVLGCFEEAPSGGGEDGTTGEPCPPQTLGCPCEAGACATDLECEASIALCIDPTCTPGTELCTCVDGSQCLTGLQCEGGLCRPPPPPPGADTTSGVATSGPNGTTGPGEDGMTIPGEADVTTVSDTLDPLTTTLPVTDDGDPTVGPTCGTSPCMECYACQTQAGGKCEIEWETCASTNACLDRTTCVFACAENDVECVTSCCAMGMLSSIPYEALANCLEDACTSCGQDLNCGI